MGMLIKKMVRMAVALVTKLIFIAVGVVICMPVFLVLTGSVMGDSDLQECLAPVFELGQGFVTWRLIPQYPTVDHYIRLEELASGKGYLEFGEAGSADFGRSTVGRRSGSMGICRVSGERKKSSFYIIYRFDASAVSGNNAFKLFNIEQTRIVKYTLVHNFTSNF